MFERFITMQGSVEYNRAMIVLFRILFVQNRSPQITLRVWNIVSESMDIGSFS
jgi:hypothetical protein